MAEFFEKLKREVDKGVTNLSVKSREVLETSRLNSQMEVIEARKKEALEELGNIVYTMHQKGSLDAERLQAKCVALAALDEQIRQKQAELLALRAQTQEALGRPKPAAVCGCGAEIHEGAKFCGKCGSAVVSGAGEDGPATGGLKEA